MKRVVLLLLQVVVAVIALCVTCTYAKSTATTVPEDNTLEHTNVLSRRLVVDDDWGADWGERDPCVKDGAFAAAMPAFLEHCGPIATHNTPCTVDCNRAFNVISRYPVCLQEAGLQDMEETPFMDKKAGLKPEEAIEIVFLMAFSKCHTATMLPAGPTGANPSSCDSLLLTQYKVDVVEPFATTCADATRHTCSEACSHYNSLLRRHPCFGRYYHHMLRTIKSDPNMRQLRNTINTANIGCALTSNKMQMIRDMCSEENLLQFQDLTWSNFIGACHRSYGAAKNPFHAWKTKTSGTASNTGAAGNNKAVTKDKTCHAACRNSLTQVLADSYCLQRFEENAASHGDVGITSLLADALSMCDLTRPPPPPTYSNPQDDVSRTIGGGGGGNGALVYAPVVHVLGVVVGVVVVAMSMV